MTGSTRTVTFVILGLRWHLYNVPDRNVPAFAAVAAVLGIVNLVVSAAAIAWAGNAMVQAGRLDLLHVAVVCWFVLALTPSRGAV